MSPRARWCAASEGATRELIGDDDDDDDDDDDARVASERTRARTDVRRVVGVVGEGDERRTTNDDRSFVR